MSKTIEQLYAVLGVNKDGVEGVATYIDPADNVMKPLVGGLSRLPTIIETAKALALASGIELQLVKFNQRENLDRVTPEDS